MVRALADSAGAGLVEVASVTAPGANLEDLWNEGTAVRRIREGGWSLVVMQQGPSSQRDGRRLLQEFTVKFAREIREQGGVPALYMVWPSRDRTQDFDATRGSYGAAAAAVDGALFPAAEAWRAAWRRDSTLVLYSSDSLHPSRIGSYLTALVMVSQILDRSPNELSARISVDGASRYTLDIADPLVALLKDAAAEAIQKFGRQGKP